MAGLDQYLIIGGVVVVSTASFAFLFRDLTMSWRTWKKWNQFAPRLGHYEIHHEPGDGLRKGPASIHAKVRDVPITLTFYRPGSRMGGGRVPPRTRVRATCRTALPPGFALERQGLIAGFTKLFGGRDVEVGDAAFDDAFLVGGQHEQYSQAMLKDPAIRATLLKTLQQEKSLEVERGVVTITRRGAITDHEKLFALLNAVTLVALALEHAATQLHQPAR